MSPFRGRAEAEPDLVVTEHDIAVLAARRRPPNSARNWQEAGERLT
jgi:hypothetical protein